MKLQKNKFIKSFCLAIILAVIIYMPRPSLSQDALNQDGNFLYPKLTNNLLLYYDREAGAIHYALMPDVDGLISTEGSVEGLGGFIDQLSWSPDVSHMAVRAENILLAKTELPFYSNTRKDGSKNWWVYEPETKLSTLMDSKIQNVGWLSNEEIIYNFDNKTIARAPINNLDNFQTIANINQGSVPIYPINPVITETHALFPSNHGVYTINLKENSYKFFETTDVLKNIIKNPYIDDRALLITEGGLSLLTLSSNTVETLIQKTISSEAAFYNASDIVFVGSDGTLYNYNIDKKEESKLEINTSSFVPSNVYALDKGRVLLGAPNLLYVYVPTTIQAEEPVSDESSKGGLLFLVFAILIPVVGVITYKKIKARKDART